MIDSIFEPTLTNLKEKLTPHFQPLPFDNPKTMQRETAVLQITGKPDSPKVEFKFSNRSKSWDVKELRTLAFKAATTGGKSLRTN